jgi:hypothetical protein
VKIKDIVGELDGQPDGWRSFLDVKTGEIVGVTVEELRAAEEERLEQFPADQENTINMAAEILDQDRFLPLPTSYEVYEYGIMERFCLSLENDRSVKLCLRRLEAVARSDDLETQLRSMALPKIGMPSGRKPCGK